MASEGPAFSGHRKPIKTQSEGLNFSLLYPTFALALSSASNKEVYHAQVFALSVIFGTENFLFI